MQPNKTVAPWKGVGCEAPDLSDTEHVGKLLTEKKETIHPMRLFLLLYNLLLIPHTMI